MPAGLVRWPHVFLMMLTGVASAENNPSSWVYSATTSADMIHDAPVRNQAPKLTREIITLGCVSSAVMILRLIINRFFSPRRSLSPADWAVFATIFLRLSATIVNVKGLVANGLGRDIWTLSPPEVERFAIYFYAIQIMYFLEITMMKLTWGLFYLSIFPAPVIRRLLWATMAFIASSGLAFVLVAAFQCTPVSYNWRQHFEKDATGTCIDENALAWSNAAISIIADFWLIAIPVIQVQRLKLHWKKKLGVIVMFLTGLFVTIVSVIRLRSIVNFSKSLNPTWDQSEIVLWSTIEVSVGMIGLCLPSIRLMLVQYAPRIFGTTTSSFSDSRGISASLPLSARGKKNEHETIAHPAEAHLSSRTWTSTSGEDWIRLGDRESLCGSQH
ncbi:hypothetical protein QQS21_004819 [Conoideocrella luteorostrata]|uniref:Rhodopsin domain-containing protein n=1 Tax=Conoideocrella luteorostrata TaxID=1105319 RepID=A0AAJ0CTJ8_9HYPO|nr:hypothetical protein QQS21_004819 [Conoideocrella luteorostrata]